MSNFVFDWTGANTDGANTVSNGTEKLTVSVSTPRNSDGSEAKLLSQAAWGGEGLSVNSVANPTNALLAFSAPVSDLSFSLFDVDQKTGTWDDKVTVIARDAAGNPVKVSFTGLTHHSVSGSTVEGGSEAQSGVAGAGGKDSVGVSIAGPVVSLEFIFDNGADAARSGTIGVSDLSFQATGTPVLNGIVEGTNGNDLIDFNYVGDPQGDRIDHNDSLKNFNDTPFTSDVPSTFVPLPGQPFVGGNRDAVLAGDGNDTIISGDSDDVVYGGNGNDQAYGGSGADVLVGDNGTDSLYGGDGMDRLFGGNDGDYLAGNNDRDRLFGENGDDTMFGGTGDDDLYGGNGQDLVQGGTGNDLLDGGEGDDSLLGIDGRDTLYGGGGQDVLYGGANGDIIDGGSGDDTVDGDDGNDTLTGGSGQDYITGDEGSDVIDGGEGDDQMLAGDGADSITGGKGNDVAYGEVGNDTLVGGDGDDRLYGGADADVFFGNSGDQIYGGSSGLDQDRLDFSRLGKIRIVDKRPDSDGNGFDGRVEILNDAGNVTGSFTFQNIEIVPCFTPGTRIATPRGEIPVEDLVAGDRIVTRDSGLQEIRWIGRKTLDWKALAANEHLRPILIQQGSLGNGLPERDMLVSPNHRMLVANERTALYFDEHEVLVAAKHLVNHKGVKAVESLGTTYLHFMFDRHEVVLANGTWTESFQPGDYTLQGVGNAQRQEIFDLFPELKTKHGREDYIAARRTLKRHEASLLNT